MSTKLSSQSNSVVKLINALPSKASLNRHSENTGGYGSIISIPGNGTSAPKSCTELLKEIATLETEILHLECHLLSLYRTAFEEHLPVSSNSLRHFLQYKTGSPSQLVANQLHYSLTPHLQRGSLIHDDQTSPAFGWVSSDSQSCTTSLHSTSKRDQKNADFGRRSLADHFGPSYVSYELNTPDKLSEDILKYISSICLRLANPSRGHMGLSASPTSSLSTSSIFSSHNACDNWSPHCNEDTTVHHQQGSREESGPYAAMTEVLKLHLDDESFSYAAVMLKNFRSLVQSLEKVDPSKMKREEKLAFWINIHNALVMHAHLAYGTQNRVKSVSIFKAAYNVGGHCINACIIQSSIFGIQSHYSEPWLQTLFSPGRKFKTGSIKHVYCLEYPEPLVHFALCSGAYSDPAVRVYSANNIFKELKLAKEEFIQANVHIHKDGKVFLPKMLSYFAKDTSMDMHALFRVIAGCLTEAQQKAMRKCSRGKVEKCIQWLSRNSSFRYVIHGDLAKGRIIV